jgi:hypothetical protein
MGLFRFDTAGDERAEAEGFVAAAFRRCHGATRVRPYPSLATLRGADGALVAAAGYRAAAAAPLFLETYLDAPVEEVIAAHTGDRVARDRIVEIGGLSAMGRRPLIELFARLARAFDAQGLDVAVVTATAKLRRGFDLIGFDATELAAADPARLPDGAHGWGRYYDTRPVVLAGRIGATRARLDAFAARSGFPQEMAA